MIDIEDKLKRKLARTVPTLNKHLEGYNRIKTVILRKLEDGHPEIHQQLVNSLFETEVLISVIEKMLRHNLSMEETSRKIGRPHAWINLVLNGHKEIDSEALTSLMKFINDTKIENENTTGSIL